MTLTPAFSGFNQSWVARFILNALYALMLSVSSHAVAQQEQAASIDTPDTPSLASEVVVVKDGDTLESISRNFFETSALWRHIAEFNQLDAADSLYSGQVILIPTLQSTPLQHATVVYTHGEAMVIRAGTSERVPLQRDDKVYPSDSVETGSAGFVSIAFENGSVINLQPGSSVTLRNLVCLESDQTCFIDVRASEGELEADVESRAGQPTEFHIRTPFASAAVRGTRFDFAATPDRLVLGVTEGAVGIRANSENLTLDPGFGSVTAAGEAPGQPVALLYPPTYTNIPPRVAVSDRLGWWQIPEAAAYQWLISTDALGSNVVTSSTTGDEFITLADLEPGEYYLSVRGVDELGLKGFATSSKFRIAGINPDLEPVDLTFARSGRELSLSIINPDEDISGYEIQLATSPDFDDVISIDVGPSGQAIFADVEDKLFLRARALVSPEEVSAFGNTVETD